jgi:hypothetical protein
MNATSRCWLEWLSNYGVQRTAAMAVNHFTAVPTALYGAVLLMAAIAYYVPEQAIIRALGPASILKKAVGRDRKGKVSPLLYFVAIVATLWPPWISGGIFVAVAVIWLIPDRRIENALSAPQLKSDRGPATGIGVTIVLGCWLACAAGIAAERNDSPIVLLSWLAGCWGGGGDGRRIEEHWMPPRGGTMLGMSRTVTGDRTSEFEYMQIREQEGRLVFTARPSRQAEASFGSIELTPTKVVFENTAHDFPQRIIYQREADGSLLARIEGERDGARRGVDFPMRRARCPEGGGRRAPSR